MIYKNCHQPFPTPPSLQHRDFARTILFTKIRVFIQSTKHEKNKFISIFFFISKVSLSKRRWESQNNEMSFLIYDNDNTLWLKKKPKLQLFFSWLYCLHYLFWSIWFFHLDFEQKQEQQQKKYWSYSDTEREFHFKVYFFWNVNFHFPFPLI